MAKKNQKRNVVIWLLVGGMYVGKKTKYGKRQLVSDRETAARYRTAREAMNACADLGLCNRMPVYIDTESGNEWTGAEPGKDYRIRKENPVDQNGLVFKPCPICDDLIEVPDHDGILVFICNKHGQFNHLRSFHENQESFERHNKGRRV